MKRVIVITLISIGVIVLAASMVLGYFGLIPVFSTLMGANSPRDLGVHYSAADLQSINAKLGLSLEKLNGASTPEQTLKLSGSKPLVTSFTQEELTALINSHSKNWKYYPVTNTQMKINSDGTLEVSGNLMLDRAQEYAEATHVSDQAKKTLFDNTNLIKNNPRFYAKGKLEVKNGQVQLEDVGEVEIGRVQAGKMLTDNSGFVASFINDRIAAAGVKVNTVSFENGQMQFNGAVPEKVGFAS